MTKRIDPDLFARLMKLSSSTRTDLLEYLGQTPLAPDEALRLLAGGTAAQDGARINPPGE